MDVVEFVVDIWLGVFDGSLEDIVEKDGVFYFWVNYLDVGFELFCYDLVIEEVVLFMDVSGSLYFEYIIFYQDKIYFFGCFSSSQGIELFVFDLVMGEVNIIQDIIFGLSNFRDLVVFNDKLYCFVYMEEYGCEFWEYDVVDSIFVIIVDIWLGVCDGDFVLFMFFNDKFYFVVNDGLCGSEIWSFVACFNIVVDVLLQVDDILGGIDLIVIGGLFFYIFDWSIGAIMEDFLDLLVGIYMVMVMDVLGCLLEVMVEIDFLSSMIEMGYRLDFQFFLNLGEGIFELCFEEVGQVFLFNQNG